MTSRCGLRGCVEIIVLLVAVAGLATAETVHPDRAARAARIRASLVEKTNSVDKDMQGPKAGDMEIRDLTNGALVAAFSGNYSQAERLYRLAFDEQVMVPGDRFGEMPWKVKDRRIKDANSIDFATQSMGVLLLAYKTKFSPDFQKYLQLHAQASVVELANHKVPVSYSNLYVMNFCNIILIAEALQDEAMMQHGYKNMDTWLDYTGRAGIHEFDSPIYNSVVLSSLMMVYQYSASAHAHRKAGEALTYVWTDLAANYFAAGRNLSGAASRAYNFLYGSGNIDVYYYWQGFQDDFAGALPLERAFLLEATKAGGYVSDVKPFLANVNRQVTQRYDDAPEKYRITYVAPGFSLGIANGNYGPQDKMFAFDFAPPAGKRELPNVYLATTTTGLPYGQDKSTDKSGYTKPHHLKNNLGAIQEQGMALMVADPDPRDTGDASTVYVDMVLPSEGELSLSGVPVAANAHISKELGAEDIVGLRIEGTCFAVRVILPEHSATKVRLGADELSASYHTFRLTAVVSASHGPSQIGYLVDAEPCLDKGNVAEDDLRQAKITAKMADHIWAVRADMKTVAYPLTSLSLDYDLAKFASTSARVNEKVFVTPTLNVTSLRVQKKPSAD